MKSKKIVTSVIAIIIVLGIAYLVDSYVFDKGEDGRAIPEVGIKATTLDPTFVTVEGQPLVLIYLKGDASKVIVDVAKRIAPTKGGDTLETYELEKLGLAVPAEKLNEEDTGELQVWGKILDVPAEAGQYLITVAAYDQKDVATKFKMFNYIMSVQENLEKIPGNTPGQNAFLSFVQNITDEGCEAAYEMLAPKLREEIDLETFKENYTGLEDAEVTNFDLIYLEPENLTESDEIVVRYPSGEENCWQVNFELNDLDPTENWQIINIEKVTK